ncbi:YjbQ family protein [Exilibacterium tricleocarpae]|uniref:YjbQ family protein n=1 Tax=Exilibacterium tricleocarpae TaxID=2591008 RepID=A0A545T8B6_9GAMM|nr:secondary thiamine-phosphate synthase enzyme YjbQ [Exilibacterium tricleocarpae]TQV73454.1 YjbQ family protein [Exilibacterium tricleocarpae]
MWIQKEITLTAKSRGFHLVTGEIERQVPELATIGTGLAHLFILHTSASLSINENADPSVRADMEAHFSRLMPENAPYYTHTCEGPDDMPAHLKTSSLGCSLSIPIGAGRLRLGTWQGIYLGEHRDRGGRRRLVVTLQGEAR